MAWLVFPSPVECRAIPNGRCVIPAGAPVWQHSAVPRMVRCSQHAPVPVDDAALDAARHALEARREGVAQLNATQPSFLPARRSRPAPFDARAAAAGEGGRS
jgi:hypothetical protein